jgi:hypothetical protein
MVKNQIDDVLTPQELDGVAGGNTTQPGGGNPAPGGDNNPMPGG